MNTHKRSTITAGSIAFAILLGACGSSTSQSAPSTTDPVSAKPTIIIATFQFSPNPVTTTSGVVTIRNDDNTTHTFTSDETGLFSVEITGPNATKTVTVPKGTHAFHCAIHPSMTGKITVS